VRITVDARLSSARLLVAAVAVLVLGPVPALLADASTGARTVTVPVSALSWYWREQPGVIGGTGAAPPQAIPDPSVPSGDVAVAGPEGPDSSGSGSGPLDETYLSFDVATIPAGSTITSFRFTLPVDSSGKNAGGAGAPVIACTPQSSWAGGEEAASFGGKPADSCPIDAPKVTSTSGGKAFTTDIAAIAQQWVRAGALNLGVAITDNPANKSTAYQIVFGPQAALTNVRATVTYVPPPGTPSPPTPAGGRVAPTPQPSLPAGVIVPWQPHRVPSVSQPSAAAAAPPTVAGQPSVTAASPAVSAGALHAASSLPPAGFWISVALVCLLLVASAWVLADPEVPLGVIADRGVARALRARIAAPREP
jgi:hypothetical protein